MTSHADDAARYVELALESVLLRAGDHVGVFYRGDEERDAFVMPLVAAALDAGCGVVYVSDRSDPARVTQQLTTGAVDVEGALGRGQLRLVASAEAYLDGGCFDPDHTVGFYKHAWQGSFRRGYPILCVIGEMSWTLRGCPGTDRLLEYEAMYAQEFGLTPAITLCLYDLGQTRGEQLVDLLRLHGRVILNGIEMQNPCADPGPLLGGAHARR
jgi:hypothetical protein